MFITIDKVIYGIVAIALFFVIYTVVSYNGKGELFDNITKGSNNYRRVKLADTKFYFLTVNNPKRKSHMLEEFKEYSPTEINPVTGISRNMSGATGFGRMIDKGLRDQNKDKPFQPFITMEDDASKMREFPTYIDIPQNADILYIGLHSWGFTKVKPINIVYSENYDDDLIKVKNLLALHGVMVCSAAGAAVIQRSMVESYYKDTPWDIPITHAQPFYKVYALKNPLVYQDKKYGGKERATKIYSKKHWFKPIPEEHINREGATNMMVQY